MKLPNGYGSIYKLSGNRRLPYTIRITLSCRRDSTGKRRWKYQYLGYYSSYEEALTQLVHLHDSTESICISYQPTFEQVFTRWSLENYPNISASNIRGYNAAFKICHDLHDTPFNMIDRKTLQDTIDHCGKNYPMLKKMKILFSSLYSYAILNDICTRDHSHYLNIKTYQGKNPNHLTRHPFIANELNLLWEHASEKEGMIVLILVYSGCRIGELLQLKKEDIHLKDRFFYVSHAKTKAGIRFVPIADKIYPLFEKIYHDSSGEYLISDSTHADFTYQHYYKYHWQPFLRRLGMPEHKPHDTRHTCVTLLTHAKVDDKLIKRIIGHAGASVTERVYTHFDLEQLKEAINKI